MSTRSRPVRGLPDEEPVDNAVPRKTAWLQAHPGAVIGRPNPRELGMRAVVDGVVVATAYADLGALMSNVERAEADGLCPRHPHAAGAPS